MRSIEPWTSGSTIQHLGSPRNQATVWRLPSWKGMVAT
jgi:hypothetical protein